MNAQGGLRGWKTRGPALLLLAILVFLPADGFGAEVCPSKLLFDTPCPLCGLTRSITSFLRADIEGSIRYHPLGWMVVAILVHAVVVNRWIVERGIVAAVVAILFVSAWAWRVLS